MDKVVNFNETTRKGLQEITGLCESEKKTEEFHSGQDKCCNCI